MKNLIQTGVILFFTTLLSMGQYGEWKHSGSIYISTTPDGANLPASVTLRNFPLLVCLHKDSFPFSQAHAKGADVRFSSNGKSLPFEIENWNSKTGEARIWVKTPVIKGNEVQEIKIHWGNSTTKSISDGKTVFSENGYVSVWHMGNELQDATGNLKVSKEQGTAVTKGMIGKGRYFSGKSGISSGRNIKNLPSGAEAHSTQAWVRSDAANGTVLGWGIEKRGGKVSMNYISPAGIRMDCYFSGGSIKASIPDHKPGWHHVVHTYANGKAALYIDGERRTPPGRKGASMTLSDTSGFWIGGWWGIYNFNGAIDEVRISKVERSADWIRLEYENQKPMQSLVGPVVHSGDDFSLKSLQKIEVNESDVVELKAEVLGARKVFWTLVKGDEEKLIAVDRSQISFAPGRVVGKQTYKIRLDAIYPEGKRSREISLTILENMPEPKFSLKAPSEWNGRDLIELKPVIENLDEMNRAGVANLKYSWNTDKIAVLKNDENGKLFLEHALGSGTLVVSLIIENGGEAISKTIEIEVKESEGHPWVKRPLVAKELPRDGQFYSRDASGMGSMRFAGLFQGKATELELRVYAGDKRYKTKTVQMKPDGAYAFAVPLKPGFIQYRMELYAKVEGNMKMIHKASDIVCGDAYLISGQSNALATDTGEDSPRVTHPWIRSYGRPSFYKKGQKENLWCKPVWKAQRNNKAHLAELGWWGMELAKQLVESQKVPVFILNGAKGGTRIDQHKRNDQSPLDLNTIYGRQLWRIKEAGLSHGIRAIIWHQGENDQGAAGPDGGYGWETYQDYFVKMSADWKRDFPNANHLYAFQIFPNACSMGNGNGNMLREKQRTLPDYYSNMTLLSTLGVKPAGWCHYPLKGWGEFANMLHPLIQRDIYGNRESRILSSANLKHAYFTTPKRDAIALEFDQAVIWNQAVAKDIRLDGKEGLVVSGASSHNVITLQLKGATEAKTISYLDERAWKQERLLNGKNGLAVLTFCRVPVFVKKPVGK